MKNMGITKGMKLPLIPDGFEWKLSFEAYGFSAEPESEKRLEEQTGITIGARSTAILVGEQKTGKENKVGVLL